MFSWAVKVWLLWRRYFLFLCLLILQFWFGSILELSASFSLSPFSPFNLIYNYSFDNLFSCMMGKFKEILMMRSWSWDYYITDTGPLIFHFYKLKLYFFGKDFMKSNILLLSSIYTNLPLTLTWSPQYKKKEKKNTPPIS